MSTLDASPRPPALGPPARPPMTGEALVVLPGEAARLGIHLDLAALERFERYLRLLIEWNERAGLTSLTEPAEVERRHFAEALALFSVLRRTRTITEGGADRLADLGPGGGFPGLPIAIAEPNLHLVLIESHGRRARFLSAVVEALGLEGRVDVVQARAEDAGRDPALRATFDLVTARALAPMPVLVEYALPLLKDGGALVAPKGSRAEEELAASAGALAALGGHVNDVIDLPLPEGAPQQRVIIIRRTGRLDSRYPRRAGVPSREPL